MNISDIARKRSILFSARIRFSPETQPVRDTAIDRIIEQNLLIAQSDEGLSLEEIDEQGAICFAGGTPAISRLDMQKSLGRLVDGGRLIVSGRPGQERYRLSQQALQELWEAQRSTEARFERVVTRLFQNAEEGSSAYATPFLECLCIIFSRLGETYVGMIKGEISHEELLGLPSVLRALQEVQQKYQWIDGSLFEAAGFSFFRDSDPDYDAIKWNMAQNYYVAKALGLDPSGYLLSEEVFADAVFYLDTNVMIPGLEPKARHHRSFQALGSACHQLKISMNVCQISLDELQAVLEYQREIIPKVVDQIPPDTVPKIRGLFFRLYREELASEGTVNLDQLLASFDDPMEVLAGSYGVELIDDLWFVQAEDQPETEELLQAIRRDYQAKRGRNKARAVALHDALLLRWIQLERERSSSNTWLVTLDTSLPGFLPEEGQAPGRPLAITLDALLQWMSPLAIGEDVEDEVAEIFSEAVRYGLLPQESFFELRDFLIFAEMEWSCKELPAEDVEECIRYLRVNAPNLDPSSPADREKLAYEISKFFADPSRKYTQEVQRLEAEKATINEEYKRKLEEINAAIRERDERIERLEKERIEREENERKRAQKKSALIRLGIVILLVVAYEAIVVWLASNHAEGTTFFQKVINSWPFLALGAPLGIGLLVFIVGKERIRILGWPFTRFLNNG